MFDEKVDKPNGKWVSINILAEIAEDEAEGKPYLICESNRDGDCYRSPWSNKYFPEVSESGETPQIYPS